MQLMSESDAVMTSEEAQAGLSPRLSRFIARSAAVVDRALDRILPVSDEPPALLHAAMRHAVFPGGKRIRPALTAMAYAAAGGRGRGWALAGSAIELVHSFSLVHDDLPCMDDSPTRRGRASVHCQFDEATALLAGDALLSLAFEILARPPAGWPRGAGEAIALALAKATGSSGMIGGQAAERDFLHSRPAVEALVEVQQMKTGRLFEASAVAGGLAAGAPPPLIAALRRYARHLGLAFQIADDLLDRAADGREAPDTYPGVAGREAAVKALATARAAALRAAGRLSPPAGDLCRDLAIFAAARQA